MKQEHKLSLSPKQSSNHHLHVCVRTLLEFNMHRLLAEKKQENLYQVSKCEII